MRDFPLTKEKSLLSIRIKSSKQCKSIACMPSSSPSGLFQSISHLQHFITTYFGQNASECTYYFFHNVSFLKLIPFLHNFFSILSFRCCMSTQGSISPNIYISIAHTIHNFLQHFHFVILLIKLLSLGTFIGSFFLPSLSALF